METTKTEIIDKAAEIIMNSGIQNLTIHKLATNLDVDKNLLYTMITKDDDILLLLLLDFEAELEEFVWAMNQNTEQPETELRILFKKLYFFFLQKPHYLAIIFDKHLKERNRSIKEALLRIKEITEKYLTGIIERGKRENTFNTSEPTQKLVERLLADFRIFMGNEQRLHEMILEMKQLKQLKD
ncbi:MAG: hypothetical protein RBS07_03910 [Lentimicrobium sp.]|jgi:AcrR family transcriptional regulator|nr:hypothetical protein [Lentimicrobium sp.]